MDYHEEMDYQRCDQVWQRVAPDLDPYPEIRAMAAPEPVGEMCPLKKGMMPMDQLRKAIEGELTARRAYLSHARCAGGSVGRTLMQMASEDGQHACRLKSLYYLLTGECWEQERDCGCADTMSLCRFLRQRYQMEMTAADRYEDWADAMEDECMASMLRQLAEDDRCHAATVMRLLENRLS